MKKVVYFLALCFLLEWAYTTKIKPFIISEFHLSNEKPGAHGAAFDTGAYCYGLDISKYQGTEVELLNRKQDSLSFVICKATEGRTEIDPDFRQNIKLIKEKGFLCGAYHFYHSDDNPLEQSAFFLKTIGVRKTDFPLIIDVEEKGIKGSDITKIRNDLLACLDSIGKGDKRVPILYTNIDVGNKYLNDARFARYPLWIASYETKGPPPLPDAWKNKEWQIWQKSAKYEVGVTANDFDVFNGGTTKLNEFAGSKE